MGATDSMRHFIIDSMVKVHDTSAIKIMLTTTAANPASPNNSTLVNTLITAFGALLGVGIGVWATVWYKKQELDGLAKSIKLQSDNFELQKQKFEQDKIIQWNQISNELSKIQDLKKNYELSLEKFSYSKYEKLIDISDRFLNELNDDKKVFIKELNSLVKEFSNQFPPSDYIDDYSEVKELMAPTIFGSFSKIKAVIDKLDQTYPHLLPNVMGKLNSIKHDIDNIVFRRHHNYSDESIEAYELFFDDEMDSVFKVYEDLYDCLMETISEFRLFDEVRTKLIKEQFIDTDSKTD